MSSVAKVFGNPNCPAVRKILIASDLAELPVDLVHQEKVSCPDLRLQTNVIYRTSQGVELTMASAALRHIARCRPDLMLYGRDMMEFAETDKWLAWVDAVLKPLARQCIAWEGEKQMCVAKAKADVLEAVSVVVEPRLVERTFIAGQRLGIADVSLFCTLAQLIATIDAELLTSSAALPGTLRWYRTMAAHAVVKKHPVTATKGGSASAAKPAEQQRSAQDIEDEIEAEEKARAKKVNPLELLPPTTLVLDEWKRVYSNSKDLRGGAMPWFWEHLDRAGWSLWYMTYDKLEGECTIGFATSNQLSGFLQRIEPSFRKYSFGVFNVVGSDNRFDIQGVFMVRGSQLPAELTDHPSYNYHKFRKLNLDDEADKALIEDYWCNDDSVENRPIESCKVWK